MPRRLRDITIREVSSVDKGAGEGVKVLLYKRNDPQAGEINMDAAALQKMVADTIAATVPGLITKALEEAGKPTADRLAKAEYDLAYSKLSPVEKAFADECEEEEKKKAFVLTPVDKRAAFMTDKPNIRKTAPVEHAELAKRDAEIADLKKALATTTAAVDGFTLEKAQREFEGRAEAIGLDKKDGEVMRKAYAGDKESQVALDKRLAEVAKANSEQAKTAALFNEFGSSVNKGGDAHQQLVAKAEEIRKAEPKLTEAQAFAKAYKDPANAAIVAASKREEMTKRANLAIVA